jgi:hypothetical protein
MWVGAPLLQLTLHCVWVPCLLFITIPHVVPLFPTRLALPLGAQPCPGLLKKVKSKPKLLLIQHLLVFFPSAPLCGRFCYDSSCGWAHLFPTRLALRLGTLPHFHYDSSCGSPSFQLALPCLWGPCLVFVTIPHVVAPLSNSTLCCVWPPYLIFITIPHVGDPLSNFPLHFVWAPCLIFVTNPHVGDPLSNSPCIVFGLPCLIFVTIPHVAAPLANSPCVAFGCPALPGPS